MTTTPETPTTLAQQHDVPGATLATSSTDGTVTRSIGWRDRTKATRLDASARFPVYSITKTMIATIILQLAEENEFTLETPLRELVGPAGDWFDPTITLRQTLNHTAGLPDYGPLPAYRDAVRTHPVAPWDDETFLACARETGMRFQPGTGWAYSNIGYLLLRRVIESVSDTSFADAVAARIAAPLGLQRTGVVETLDAMHDLTPGISAFLAEDGEAETDITCHYHPGWVAHGLVSSTAADVARFVFALLSGNVLAPASLDAMLTPIRVPIEHHPLFREPSYGLGVMLDPAADGGMLVGHGGGGPGFSLGVLSLRAHDRVVVAAGMANSDRGDIGLELAFRELRRMTHG